MSKFKGFRKANHDCIVLVNEGGDAWANLPMYLNEVNHSPTGFEWGYYGSGPSQLSYAIVRYLAGKDTEQPEAKEFAELIYIPFKQDVIGNLPYDSWELEYNDAMDIVKELNDRAGQRKLSLDKIL
ncbi:MAG: DUF6166 domain-containing protein [Novosphingobium sp.]|nr:DUF6166 domain-containing protein [Novosphingobium sp.]